MGLLILLGFVFLIVSNARIASKKGLNPILWGMLTFAGFFVGYMTVGMIYFSFVYKGPLTPDSIRSWAEKSELAVDTLVLLSFSGMLLVRFLLEKRKVREG